MDILIILIALIILAQTTYIVVATSSRKQRVSRQSIYVDTSVLIDGRILAIAEAGFIPGELVIPRSVLRELQLLADGGDSDKRAKARKGMDLVRKLQSIEDISVRIMQDGIAEHGVDEQLIVLAKKYSGSVCTVDYNLNKVAQVEGVTVLNINELAKNIRSVHMPGEHVEIELVAKGQDSHQAVGYLDDGTMVVVENASKFVGGHKEVEFIRLLQTDAGKMMFAKLAHGAKHQSTPKKVDKQPVRRVVSRKAGGRKVSSGETSTPRDSARVSQEKPKKQKESQPNQRRAAPPARNSSGRKTNEDSLIDLIDKQ